MAIKAIQELRRAYQARVKRAARKVTRGQREARIEAELKPVLAERIEIVRRFKLGLSTSDQPANLSLALLERILP